MRTHNEAIRVPNNKTQTKPSPCKNTMYCTQNGKESVQKANKERKKRKQRRRHIHKKMDTFIVYTLVLKVQTQCE